MNRHIREKTRLVVCDGLIGQFARDTEGFAQRWETLASDGGVPNSVFFATDPVALESVLLHFVNRERSARGMQLRRHDYLHSAAEQGLGIYEDIEDLQEIQQISYEVA